MSELSEQELQHAYEQITSGNVDAVRALLAADYVLHIPSVGLTVSGRDQALQVAVRVIEQLQVRSQRLERVERHGEFVVGFMSGNSGLRGDFHGIDVSRVDDNGLIAEAYLHRPPLPPGVEAPADTAAGGG